MCLLVYVLSWVIMPGVFGVGAKLNSLEETGTGYRGK